VTVPKCCSGVMAPRSPGPGNKPSSLTSRCTVHLAHATWDCFFHRPSPGGARDWEHESIRGPGTCRRGWRGTGEGSRCPAAPGNGAQREPEAPTRCRGRKPWFSAAASGEIQQDGCFVSARASQGPRHLAEKGAHVLGKLKIDLRLFSHQPRAGGRITSTTMIPPPAPAAWLPGDRLPLLPCASSHLSAAQRTRSWQPSKGSSSQPETLTPRSPRSNTGRSSVCTRQGHQQREGTCLKDVPWGHAWDHAPGMNHQAAGSRLMLFNAVISIQPGAILDIPPGHRVV